MAITTLELYIDTDDFFLNDEYIKAVAKYNSTKSSLHRDSGFDLFVSNTILVNDIEIGSFKQTIEIDHMIVASLYSESKIEEFLPTTEEDELSYLKTKILRTPLPYYLYPRSSIAKTPLRLANSVGIIDSGYTGHLKAMVDCWDNFEIKKGMRLFQLCAPDLKPFDKIVIVHSLSKETNRGDKGFGSTGIYKQYTT